MLRSGLSLLAALTLFGCAHVPAPPGPHPRPGAAAASAPGYSADLLNDPIRLFRVAYPLLRAADGLCKDAQAHALGLYALNRFGMGRFADQARMYGIGNRLKILYAVPDGPAYKAGIRADDVVLSVNGVRAPTDARSTAIFAAKMALLSRTGRPAEFTLRRNGRTLKTTVYPERICGYDVHITRGATVNAVTDGSRHILVTSGMMRFAKTDADLALVLSHEIAHDLLHHHRRRRMQLLRSLPAARADGAPEHLSPVYSRALEIQADYVGLYIMARAGMPIEDTPDLLERMAATHGRNAYPADHPLSRQRLSALRKTIREIERKRAAGLPLVPDSSRLEAAGLGATSG